MKAMGRSRDSKGGGEDNEKKRNREEHKARSRQWNTVGSDDDENDQNVGKHRRYGYGSHSGSRDSGSVESVC